MRHHYCINVAIISKRQLAKSGFYDSSWYLLWAFTSATIPYRWYTLLINVGRLKNSLALTSLISSSSLSNILSWFNTVGASRNKQDNRWYARSRVCEEESDSEGSDGYTEPWIDPSTGYKSLSRHSNDNNKYTTTKQTSLNDSRTVQTSYQSLQTSGDAHYDGCYLELKQ